AAALPHVREILTVTNRDLYFKTADEYAAVNPNSVPLGFILEPQGRNTAAAIAAAALSAHERLGPEAVLLSPTADHLIADLPAFIEAAAEAHTRAGRGRVVTFGIRPTVAETGYGYIEGQGNDVMRFIEKPPLDRAQEYVTSGRFLWNSGMFCLTTATALHELEKHAPALHAGVRATLAAATTTQGPKRIQIELDAATFADVPDVSFDYALMERTRAAAVVPCSIGWSDVGSWTAVGDLIAPDANGNRTEGDCLLHDSSNCYI